MADSKITALTALTAADPANDMLPIVDVSDNLITATGTTKRISINNILACSPSATLASATITGAATAASLTVTGSSIPTNGLYLPTTNTLEFAANSLAQYRIAPLGVFSWFDGAGGTRMTLNSTGLGVGVTPSAWGSNNKAVQVGQLGSMYGRANLGYYGTKFNLYDDNTNNIAISTNFVGEYRFEVLNGNHVWLNKSTAGSIGVAQTLTQAMVLDASGNLLVGPSTATSHTFYKNASDGSLLIDFSKSNGVPSFRVYTCNAAVDPNTAEAAAKFWRSATTSRSINAAGTVNASGADYAEYMTKASDFVLAKGDVAGIDANGKLTNVFSDAVSFVVKSTDPSYVGNDKWSVGLDGDALEAARQLVDRIAFAGQVPVNVTGAKAGDYIVPVVNGTGIKGQAVSNPTFEQYQLAVGKVISIDADGRARIIVKVA